MIWVTTKIVVAFSFIIEFLQLLFHLGTFQISDLCYNTLGGTIGGEIYFVSYKLKNEKN
ncbi:VanZ family protein [Ruminococcus sp. OM08-7]|nr:VanZ family protein [Ruminococcus sp. OM08-7]